MPKQRNRFSARDAILAASPFVVLFAVSFYADHVYRKSVETEMSRPLPAYDLGRAGQ